MLLLACCVLLATAGQTVEYKAKEKQVVWNIKKFTGGTELTLRTRITLSSASSGSVRKELGPIRCDFCEKFNTLSFEFVPFCNTKFVVLCGWLQHGLRDPDVQRQ